MSDKILVTGGTGFIGSHTVVELEQAGYQVVIVDDLSSSTVEVIDAIEKITGIRPEFANFDLSDRAKTLAFFLKNSDVKAVIHFAAFKAVGESVTKPLEYYRNNVNSLLNILEAMKLSGVSSLSLSSYQSPRARLASRLRALMATLRLSTRILSATSATQSLLSRVSHFAISTRSALTLLLSSARALSACLTTSSLISLRLPQASVRN